MKIIVSSWPACGATTLTMILSKNLNLKLYRGSETFRFFNSELEKRGSGTDLEKTSEELIQPYWAAIYDKYIIELYDDANVDNIIVDSDITGFLIKNREKVHSTFLYASDEVREKHFNTDSRNSLEESFKARDDKLNRTYNKLYGIEFLNVDYIKKYYDLPIDNSEVTIAPELILVYEDLYKKKLISEEVLKDLISKAEMDEKEYWDLGKDYLKNLLLERGLVISGKEIVKEIVRKHPEEISKLPQHLKEIIQDEVV